MSKQYYLVTYETRQIHRFSDMAWTRENEVIEGCPGVWWASQLEWYRNYHEEGRKKEKEYKARGEEIPSSEKVIRTDLRFITATPITKAGYDALDGVVG